MSRRHLYKWVQRFLQQGLEGLHDKPGRGRPPDLFDQNDVDVVF
jgi:transposase